MGRFSECILILAILRSCKNVREDGNPKNKGLFYSAERSDNSFAASEVKHASPAYKKSQRKEHFTVLYALQMSLNILRTTKSNKIIMDIITR